MADSIAQDFKQTVKSKLFDEYWPRMYQCIHECDEELLWFRPNDQCNSIGNLVLHLEGNVRQWIIHGISGKEDIRERSKEFDHNVKYSSAELIEKMEQLKSEAASIIDGIERDELIEPRTIQGYDKTVLGVLFQVTEHFSYHLGQISYLVKSQKNIDLGYYAGRKLD